MVLKCDNLTRTVSSLNQKATATLGDFKDSCKEGLVEVHFDFSTNKITEAFFEMKREFPTQILSKTQSSFQGIVSAGQTLNLDVQTTEANKSLQVLIDRGLLQLTIRPKSKAEVQMKIEKWTIIELSSLIQDQRFSVELRNLEKFEVVFDFAFWNEEIAIENNLQLLGSLGANESRNYKLQFEKKNIPFHYQLLLDLQLNGGKGNIFLKECFESPCLLSSKEV